MHRRDKNVVTPVKNQGKVGTVIQKKYCDFTVVCMCVFVCVCLCVCVCVCVCFCVCVFVCVCVYLCMFWHM